MDNIKNTGEECSPKQESSRIAYVTPSLKEFGPIAALTQGGTGSIFEGGMGMAPGMQPMQ